MADGQSTAELASSIVFPTLLLLLVCLVCGCRRRYGNKSVQIQPAAAETQETVVEKVLAPQSVVAVATATEDTSRSVMISYSHKDTDFAHRLVRFLQTEANMQVWIDDQITPGNSWRKDIAEAIERSFAVVFIISPDSLQSKYCKEELYYAICRKRILFPVVCRKPVLPHLHRGMKLILQRIHWIDFVAYGFDNAAQQLRTQLFKKGQSGLDTVHEKRSGNSRAASHSRQRSIPNLSGLDSASDSSRIVSAKPSPEQTVNVYVCYDVANDQDTKLAQQMETDLKSHKLNIAHSTEHDAKMLEGDGIDSQTRVEDTLEAEAESIDRSIVVIFVLSDSAIESSSCQDQIHYACESNKEVITILPTNHTGQLEDMSMSTKGGALGMMLAYSTLIDFQREPYEIASLELFRCILGCKQRQLRKTRGLPVEPLESLVVRTRDMQILEQLSPRAPAPAAAAPRPLGFYKQFHTIVKENSQECKSAASSVEVMQ